MTGMILRELDRGRFDFRRFYYRRARRLLPACYSTLLATTIAGYLAMTTEEWSEYLKQLLGALTFSANFVLAAQGGYFAATRIPGHSIFGLVAPSNILISAAYVGGEPFSWTAVVARCGAKPGRVSMAGERLSHTWARHIAGLPRALCLLHVTNPSLGTHIGIHLRVGDASPPCFFAATMGQICCTRGRGICLRGRGRRRSPPR